MDTEKNLIDENEVFDKSLRIMEVVEKELEQQKSEATFCLTTFLCAMSAWIMLVALWYESEKPIQVTRMTLGVEIIASLMLIFVLKFTRIDIRKMGITGKNLGTVMKRGAIISAASVVAMVVYKLVTQDGMLSLNWSEFEAGYALTSVLQEFLARGFLVTTLVKINPAKNSKHIAVICSSLMFTSLHLYYGFAFMVAAGLLSVVLGYCYLKDGSIWGVSLIHFVVGMAAFVFELV